MMRRALPILLLAPLLIAGCGGGDDSSTTAEFSPKNPITIFAPTSLDGPFGTFTRGSNLNTNISYTGSDQAAEVLRGGQPPDLYVADSTTLTDDLFNDGLISEPVAIATDELVLAVPTDSKIESIDDLAEPGVKVAVGRESLPIGGYTADAMAALPQSEQQAIAANVTDVESNNNGIVLALKEGDADAGIVYASDVRGSAKKLRAIDLPPDLQQTIVYAGAVPVDAKNPAGGQHFLDAMIDGQGAEDLKKAGFGPPPAG